MIWTHTNNYGSKLQPSLVSQAITRVNCHLAELTSQSVFNYLTEIECSEEYIKESRVMHQYGDETKVSAHYHGDDPNAAW